MYVVIAISSSVGQQMPACEANCLASERDWPFVFKARENDTPSPRQFLILRQTPLMQTVSVRIAILTDSHSILMRLRFVAHACKRGSAGNADVFPRRTRNRSA